MTSLHKHSNSIFVIVLFYTAYGCLTPESNFTYNGTFLQDGKIPINESISIECSSNVTVHSMCSPVTDYLSGVGQWSVTPECPPISKCSGVLFGVGMPNDIADFTFHIGQAIGSLTFSD